MQLRHLNDLRRIAFDHFHAVKIFVHGAKRGELTHETSFGICTFDILIVVIDFQIIQIILDNRRGCLIENRNRIFRDLFMIAETGLVFYVSKKNFNVKSIRHAGPGRSGGLNTAEKRGYESRQFFAFFS